MGEIAASQGLADKPCPSFVMIFFLNQAIDEQNITHLPTTVKSIMDSWTYQGGFPVVTLNVSTGVMKQEPFYLEKAENRTLANHK